MNSLLHAGYNYTWKNNSIPKTINRMKLQSNPIHLDFDLRKRTRGLVRVSASIVVRSCVVKTRKQKHLKSKHLEAHDAFEERPKAEVQKVESYRAKKVSVKHTQTGNKNNNSIQSALGRISPITAWLYSHDDPRQRKINENIAFLCAAVSFFYVCIRILVYSGLGGICSICSIS